MISVISLKKNGLAATNPKPSKKNKQTLFQKLDDKHQYVSSGWTLKTGMNQPYILGPPSQK